MGYKSVNKHWNKPAPVKVGRVERNWSDFQKAIFQDISSGTGHTQVIARAGSGKSSTIIEGFYHLPKGKTALMVAFNKSIQTELESKAPSTVQVLTLHALGFRACKSAFPRLGSPDNEKMPNYIKSLIGEEDNYELRTNLAKTVSLAKGCLADSFDQIDQLIDQYGIDTCSESRNDFITMVIKTMELCKKDTNRVDFDDMIWFCIVHRLRMPKYDYVFVDEAQDLNNSQIELALACCADGGRIISVGDPKQAIYGFRGANVRAIDNIIDRLGAKTLPLSVTYRCAKNIVTLANQLVPDLEYAPNANEGSVTEVDEQFMENNVRAGDFILSRTNAPLIGWCLALLKNRVPANIQGKDLGKNLLSLIKKSKAKDVTQLIDWVQNWCNQEVERLVQLKRDHSVVQDKAECIYALCEGANSISEVKDNLDKLFHDGNDTDRVILSTTHKAKGLERDRVFMLRKTYRQGQSEEEDNLVYVAWTRAKENLFLVS